jgi:uncharacterized membrane protein
VPGGGRVKDINSNPYVIMALGWCNLFMAMVCFVSGIYLLPIGVVCILFAIATIFRLLNLEEEK